MEQVTVARIGAAWNLQFGFDHTALRPDSKLGEQGFDDADWFDAVCAIEDEFDIVLEESQLLGCRTMQDVVDLVKGLLPCGLQD